MDRRMDPRPPRVVVHRRDARRSRSALAGRWARDDLSDPPLRVHDAPRRARGRSPRFSVRRAGERHDPGAPHRSRASDPPPVPPRALDRGPHVPNRRSCRDARDPRGGLALATSQDARRVRAREGEPRPRGDLDAASRRVRSSAPLARDAVTPRSATDARRSRRNQAPPRRARSRTRERVRACDRGPPSHEQRLGASTPSRRPDVEFRTSPTTPRPSSSRSRLARVGRRCAS